MKELSNKYKVPEETLKLMVKDGVISCSWPGYDEIYLHYKRNLQNASSIHSAVVKTSAETNTPESTVYYIIHKYQ